MNIQFVSTTLSILVVKNNQLVHFRDNHFLFRDPYKTHTYIVW